MQSRFFLVVFAMSLVFTTAGQDVFRSSDSLLNTLNDTATVCQEASGTQAPPIMDKKWNQIKTRFFTLNIGFVILLDHNILV